jgi:DNA repair protein RecN (Recombination protein N)
VPGGARRSTIHRVLRRLRIENLVLIREAELVLAPGLNAVTGETGAGKTILAQAIGLLLGARGDAAIVGEAGDEAYVEAELDVPDELFDGDLAALAELRPSDEPGLVLARRVFADGRTRGYAWGRAVARDDLAAAAERLIAMSGQFEQRRLARPAYQLEVLDRFCGEEQGRRLREAQGAWRTLRDAQRRHDELAGDAGAARARLAELRALVEDTSGLEAGEEQSLRETRERMRHVAELGAGAVAASDAIESEDGPGAATLAAAAEAALAPIERLAPELASSVTELRELTIRLREVATDLRRFVDGLDTDPATLEEIEERLELWTDLRRRYRAQTAEDLIDRRDAALVELEALAEGGDPLDVAQADLDAARRRVEVLADELGAARRAAVDDFAAAVSAELKGVGMGEGEFAAELDVRELGPTGRDDVSFLVRPNAGLPLAAVASTASGGELSRIALAIAAVAGGETLVFDEIDAGIGGTTAHRVAETLRRLAGRAQVLTITHLPQIASVADAHFRVEKLPGDPTHTRIELLDDDDRRAELERMLGGEEFLSLVARGDGSPTDGDDASR